MSDVFPKTVYDRILRPARHPHSSTDLKQIQSNKEIVAFTTSIHSCKIVFEPLKGDWDRILCENFLKSGQDAKQVKYFEPERMDWNRLYKRLLRSVGGKRNTDVRTSFKWDDTFLVKAFFTFGQREVQKGTWHIFETGDAPLLLYLASSKRNDIFYGRKAFVVENQKKYKRFILYPHSVYKLVPETVYVLTTCQKSLFTLRIVKENAKLPFKAEEPTETTWKNAIFLPPTPAAREETSPKRDFLREFKIPKKVPPAVQPEPQPVSDFQPQIVSDFQPEIQPAVQESDFQPQPAVQESDFQLLYQPEIQPVSPAEQISTLQPEPQLVYHPEIQPVSPPEQIFQPVSPPFQISPELLSNSGLYHTVDFATVYQKLKNCTYDAPPEKMAITECNEEPLDLRTTNFLDLMQFFDVSIFE